ncbi:MAG: hypothetical protein J0L97_05055 [Alphaproteobacteria bacterium]|nr:hypothetical protein [Alphaproteobacteria bacterium]
MLWVRFSKSAYANARRFAPPREVEFEREQESPGGSEAAPQRAYTERSHKSGQPVPRWNAVPGLISQKNGDEIYHSELRPFPMYYGARALAKKMLQIAQGESNGTIAVAGDFDTDGITSGTMLSDVADTFFRILNVDPGFVVRYTPLRRQGHGLNNNPAVVRELMQEWGVEFLLGADFGSNAVETADIVHEYNGMICILDHHALSGDLARADFNINPQFYLEAWKKNRRSQEMQRLNKDLLDRDSPVLTHAEDISKLTGAGLSWMYSDALVQAFEHLAEEHQRTRQEPHPLLTSERLDLFRAKVDEQLVLAMIGTVGDQGDTTCWPNSYFLQEGARQLISMARAVVDIMKQHEGEEDQEAVFRHAIEQTACPGLMALIRRMGTKLETLASYSADRDKDLEKILTLIHFTIAPPINASNRVGGELVDLILDVPGRVGKLSLAQECLTTKDGKLAMELAEGLVWLNGLRRDLQHIAEMFKEVVSYQDPVLIVTIPAFLNFAWSHVAAQPENFPYFAGEREKSKFATYGLCGLIASTLAETFSRPCFVGGMNWEKATHKKVHEDEIDMHEYAEIEARGSIEGYRLVQYKPERMKGGYGITFSCRIAPPTDFLAPHINLVELIEAAKKANLVDSDDQELTEEPVKVVAGGGGHKAAAGFTITGATPEEVSSKIERLRELIWERCPHYAPEMQVREVHGYALANELYDALRAKEGKKSKGLTQEEKKAAIKEACQIYNGENGYHKWRMALTNVRLELLEHEDATPYRFRLYACSMGHEIEIPEVVVELAPDRGPDLVRNILQSLDKNDKTPELCLMGYIQSDANGDAIMRFMPIDVYQGLNKHIIQEASSGGSRAK